MTNLSVCPVELTAVDPNAPVLWAILLKRVGLHLDRLGDVIEDGGKRADIVRRFATPSLIARLTAQETERDRARIWWREAIACSEGGSDIPDLSSENFYVVNPFIVTPSLKYPDPRAERLRELNRLKCDSDRREANARRVAGFRARKRLTGLECLESRQPAENVSVAD
jgi:hypothetical protein